MVNIVSQIECVCRGKRNKNIFASHLILLLLLTGCKSTDSGPVQYKANDELVVLAHGLGRSDWAMRYFAQQLKRARYKVCSLDYTSIGQSVKAVLLQTNKQINACISNANKIHFVGHSLGGLIIRAYLQNNSVVLNSNKLGNVVLIGTPNKGSELANHLNGSWLLHIAGGVSQALVTGDNSLGNTIDELDINVGVIAGTKASALTQHYFNGKNDGLVSVESTKLSNMRDFITLDVSHTGMRYNQQVIQYTLNFLQTGAFLSPTRRTNTLY